MASVNESRRPRTSHGQACNIAFADGHAAGTTGGEMRKISENGGRTGAIRTYDSAGNQKDY
jgi:prepilin-type processing-associated H-X9-DG protein